jgi:hypothetical protein
MNTQVKYIRFENHVNINVCQICVAQITWVFFTYRVHPFVHVNKTRGQAGY